MKKQTRKWEGIFVNHVSDKDLYLEYVKTVKSQ